MPDQLRKVIFIAILLCCILLPIEAIGNFPLYISAPIALCLGILIALLIGHPYLKMNSKATKMLLQISVVCLGFHLDFEHALKAGKQGLLFTIFTIALTLVAGYFIGKWLKIDRKISYLISNGTAICGGSAIAAVAPIIKADAHEISVSLGTVFILNSIALLIFPSIGHYLGLSAEQFGTWCAIAIHDTSSVVGAATGFKDSLGHEALPIATTIKLERALWIIPISLATAWYEKGDGTKVKLPWFILYFVIAILVSTYLPIHMPALNTSSSIPTLYGTSTNTLFGYLYLFGKKGLVITLFLIGSGLSLNSIREVGARPIIQGVLLWILIGVISLVVIRGVI